MTSDPVLPLSRRFVGSATDPASRQAIAMAAAAHGWVDPEIIEGGLENVHAQLATGPAPGFLVLDLSSTKAPLPAVDALADLCDPETRVIAIGTQNDVRLYRGLRALGICDYLLKPIDHQQMVAAIEAALATANGLPASETAGEARAPVVALVGTRGGAGCSALAASVASLCARAGKRTVLIDLDVQGGSLALDLDCEASPAIAQLLQSPERVDPLVIGQALKPHREGFRLLASDAAIETSLILEPDAVLALVSAAAADADIVVIDMPRWLDRSRRAVLRTVDRLAIVTPLTLAGLRDTRRMSGLAAGLRAGQRPLVVASRVGAFAAELDCDAFVDCLEAPIDWLVPEVPEAARRATEAGATLASVAPPALAEPLAGLALDLSPLPLELGRQLPAWRDRLSALLRRAA